MKLAALMLLVLVALLAAVGNLFFKRASLSGGKSFLRKIFSWYFVFGGGFFVLCPVISSFCARYIEFTVMYAMTALNFVFILLLSRLFLKEKLDRYKLAGVGLIVAGILLIVFA